MNDAPDPACRDDRRFTSTDRDDIAEARAICGTCPNRACQPILADILTDRTAAEFLEGVWDGRYYSANTTGRKKGAA